MQTGALVNPLILKSFRSICKNRYKWKGLIKKYKKEDVGKGKYNLLLHPLLLYYFAQNIL